MSYESIFKATAAAVACAAACLLSTCSAHAETPVLVGTWIEQFQLVDCKTGAKTGKTFLSLVTFNGDKTVTDSSAQPGFHPALRGPGHGAWIDLGVSGLTQRYESDLLALITHEGVQPQAQEVRQLVEFGLSSSKFESPAVVLTVIDEGGNVQESKCATAIGQKFKTTPVQ